MRVLLAFENSLSRDFAQNHLVQNHQMIADADLTILTVASLAEAVASANETDELALAVLDLQMPDMQGLKGRGSFAGIVVTRCLSRSWVHGLTMCRLPVSRPPARPGLCPIISALTLIWGRFVCSSPVNATSPST